MNLTNLDFAKSWQLLFQDPATPIMEGIIDLHHNIFFFLLLILFLVLYILFSFLNKFYYSWINPTVDSFRNSFVYASVLPMAPTPSPVVGFLSLEFVVALVVMTYVTALWFVYENKTERENKNYLRLKIAAFIFITLEGSLFLNRMVAYQFLNPILAILLLFIYVICIFLIFYFKLYEKINLNFIHKYEKLDNIILYIICLVVKTRGFFERREGESILRNGLRSGTFLVVFYTLSCYSDSPFFVRLVIIYLVTAFLSTTLIRFLYKEDSRVTQYFESRLLTNSLYYQRRIGSNAKRSRLFDYVIRHYGSEIISVVRSSKPIFVAMALTGCGMMFDADGYARIDERIDRTNEETYWFNRNQNDAAHAAGRVPPIQKGYLNYPSYVPGRGARDNVKEGYRAVKEAIHKWWS